MTPTDLAEIPRLHAPWRAGDTAGKRANLAGADLADADLTDANLAGADLTGAKLTGANLTGATMPDGRTWEAYRADHLAGICSDPVVKARAVAAWGAHKWTSCPMHSALGIDGLTDISDADTRRNVAAWVALYDAGLLDKPGQVTE